MAVSNHKNDNPLLKEYFFTALIMLMEQKDFKDITITEIAKKAGVSRMTYYRIYSSKEDILIQYFDDRSKKIIAQLDASPEMTIEQFMTLFFSTFKEHAKLINYVYQAGLMAKMLDCFTEFLRCMYSKTASLFQTETDIEYHIRFISGGLYMMLFRWQETGFRETPQEMANLTTKILFHERAADK